MKRFLGLEPKADPKRRKEARRVLLTADGRSWVDIIDLPGASSDPTAKRLLECKPAERGTVMMRGKIIQVPRWQASYGLSYTFSGQEHDALEMPEVIQEFLDWTNTTKYVTDRADGFAFNQVLGNWYMNGNEYIGPHSDDERQLMVTLQGDTTILGANYGAERTVRFKPKSRCEKSKGFPQEGYSTDLVLRPGTAYVMGGQTQRTHTHQIVKVAGAKGLRIAPRISLTARCFVGRPRGEK